jgi:hypothetical protein
VHQGERHVYTLDVAAGQDTLTLTLLWDDFPGDPLAARALVNDLDLIVLGPDGRRHFPWTLDLYEPEQAAQCVQADHTNNTEQVHVTNPDEGTWLIVVWAMTVPQPDQTYSLLTDFGPLTLASAGTPVLSIRDGFEAVVTEFEDLGGLVVRDWFGGAVACLDANGNLCLHGRLYENPSP